MGANLVGALTHVVEVLLSGIVPALGASADHSDNSNSPRTYSGQDLFMVQTIFSLSWDSQVLSIHPPLN